MKKKVVVLMGGWSSEHEVSLASGQKILESFNKEKYEVCGVVISKDKNDSSFIEEIRRIKPEVVFIAMHGVYGEDGRLQGLLDVLGIKYVGSGVLASAIGMDKLAFKRAVDHLKILVPKWSVMEKSEVRSQELVNRFGLPMVIKPVDGGSSVGVSIVKSEDQILDAVSVAEGKKVLIEEYIEGIEVSCGVLGNEEPVALPVIEIVPKKDFFDYEAKYTEGMSEEIVPARISPEMSELIRQQSVEVYKEIGCSGFARVDFIIRGKEAFVLEINTIPGMTPTSLLPKEAAAAGIEYEVLLDRLVELALEKN